MAPDLEIRLECLKLAASFGAADCVHTAHEYLDFVIGRNDAEIVAAAKEFANKIRPVK